MTNKTNGTAGTIEVRKPQFELIPFGELKPRPDPAYLIKGLIPRRGLIVVWGPPKCGKSFWTFDALLHVSLGWKYRGRKVTSGPVVYCAFEGGDGYGARTEAFRLRKLPDKADDPPFHLIAARADLVVDHAKLIAAIKSQLSAVKPVAVVLDTLNRSINGSESDDRDMSAYINAADAIGREFDCAVIIVHHCGVDERRPRGHTSLTGAVDAQLAVKRDPAGNIVVEVEWMKDGAEGETVVSRLEPVEVGTDTDEDPITSCVVVPVEGDAAKPAAKGAKPPKMPKGAKIALRALLEAVAECGTPAPASNHIPTRATVVSMDQWRDYAYRRGISAGEARAQQKAFKTATEHLLAAGDVGAWDGNVWAAR